jgi:hypothetical protein
LLQCPAKQEPPAIRAVLSELVLSGYDIGYDGAYRSPRESRGDGIWLRAPCRATQEHPGAATTPAGAPERVPAGALSGV